MGRRAKSSFDPFELRREVVPPAHMCDKEGCMNAGEFRAPKDKSLREYYWFCLEHVKEYNEKWDFYAGMSPEEIEVQLKADVCWQRPTWKLGERAPDSSIFSDPLGIKREAFGEEDAILSSVPRNVDPALAAAARILEVAFPLEMKAVRLNYKRLAKAYHPDSNNGDKVLEEKFKDITEAYRLIISALNTERA